MATNFEFYKDEILGLAKRAENFSLVNGKINRCKNTKCSQCYFKTEEGSCVSERLCWLYAEHIEQPKLTKRERAFCESVQTGWVARECNMHLFYFSKKPQFAQGAWMTHVGQHCRIKGIEDDFIFIKDTDAECWAVEDLLKLDVIEEVQEDA